MKNLDDYTREELLKIIEDVALRGYLYIKTITHGIQDKVIEGNRGKELLDLSGECEEVKQAGRDVVKITYIISPLMEISKCFIGPEDASFAMKVIEGHKKFNEYHKKETNEE